jgi:hypothetical protein
MARGVCAGSAARGWAIIDVRRVEACSARVGMRFPGGTAFFPRRPMPGSARPFAVGISSSRTPSVRSASIFSVCAIDRSVTELLARGVDLGGCRNDRRSAGVRTPTVEAPTGPMTPHDGNH